MMDKIIDSVPPSASARALVRRAWKAALGTLERTTGHPFTSLVSIATEPDGTPLLLLSRLAQHTRNLEQDQRASLLIDGTGAGSNALAGDRVTLIGTVAPTNTASARARFLARHPSARSFADFSDFALYHLQVERAHFVGGFGRIVAFDRSDLLVPTEDAHPLIAAEAELVSQLNEDHADRLELIAAQAGHTPGGWRVVGIDPEGFDLTLADCALRLTFEERMRTANEARGAILARAAAH
jgi:putative heme iron utilization protein